MRGAGTILGLFALSGCAAGDAVRGVDYRPPADADRPASVAVTGADDIGLVSDFDLSGDTLYLLERTSRVVLLERTPGGWRFLHSFGRAGGGPGEFVRPTSLAVTAGGVVVADAARLQFFTPAGELVATRPLVLPCPMTLPFVAAARTGLFVHGNCLRRGYATDTMKAILLWTADTASYRVIAEDVRYTRDGSVGSAFAAWHGFTGGGSGRHLFGSGARNCIWRIDETGSAPAATQLCPAAATLYADDPPPAIAKRIRTPIAGTQIRWPPHLAVYVERLSVDDDVVLVRPFSTDSVLLQLMAPHEEALAVAPLEGLLGCRAAGCVWLFEEETPTLIVLDVDYVRRRAGALGSE